MPKPISDLIDLQEYQNLKGALNADFRAAYKKDTTSPGLGGKVAHAFFTSKDRKDQLDILEALILCAQQGKISAQQFYGGLVFLRSVLQNAKYPSRLGAIVDNLCLQMEQDNSELAVGDTKILVEHFKSYATPSSKDQNNPFNKIKNRIEPLFARSLIGVAIEGGKITQSQRTNAANLIEQFYQEGTSGIESQYESGRKYAIKSRIRQDKSRPAQIDQLQSVLIQLRNNEAGYPDTQKGSILIGCLLDIREQMKAKGQNPANSTLGKMVLKMWKEIGLPKDIDKIDTSTVDDCKRQYEAHRSGNIKVAGVAGLKPVERDAEGNPVRIAAPVSPPPVRRGPVAAVKPGAAEGLEPFLAKLKEKTALPKDMTNYQAWIDCLKDPKYYTNKTYFANLLKDNLASIMNETCANEARKLLGDKPNPEVAEKMRVAILDGYKEGLKPPVAAQSSVGARPAVPPKPTTGLQPQVPLRTVVRPPQGQSYLPSGAGHPEGRPLPTPPGQQQQRTNAGRQLPATSGAPQRPQRPQRPTPFGNNGEN